MRNRRLTLALSGVTIGSALASCGDISMFRQAKYLPQSSAPLFADGGEAQGAPQGAVALGAPDAEAQALTPPPVSLALVQRGRERHAIACAPCHGDLGWGNGPAVERGFPRPPPYADAHVQALSGRQLYDVITGGYGVMYAQAERVEPRDRWAIVAYLRALQVAARPAATGKASS